MLVGAVGDHAALLHDDHTIGKLRDDAHVVLDEEDGATGTDVTDERDGALHVLEAHPRGRLVQQQKPWLEREGKRELQGTLLSVRQAVRGARGDRAEADLFKDVHRSFAIARHRALRRPEVEADGVRDMERQDDVLERGAAVEEARYLERTRDAHAADAVRRESGDVGPERDDAARRGLHEAGEHVEERRLPGAVRPHERVYLPILERERHSVDSAESREVLREVSRLEHAHRRAIVAAPDELTTVRRDR